MKKKEGTGQNLDDGTKAVLHKLSEREYTEDDINEAEKKADSEYRTRLGGIWDRVRLLFHIARHPLLWGAQYAVMATLAVMYLVSPVDAVPDFIPVGGLADDTAVIAAVIALIVKAISSFTKEKKLELRKSIPEDLLSLYDSLTGLTADDIAPRDAPAEEVIVEEQEEAPHGIRSVIQKAVDRGAEKLAGRIDPVIEMEVRHYLDRMHYRRLASSLGNLVLYIIAVMLVIFPVFGNPVSSIISSLLLLGAIGYALFRFMRLLRNPHTIPLAKEMFRSRSMKGGIAEYIRSLDLAPAVYGERIIDGFFRVIGKPVNKRFLDRAVDHCWTLLRSDIIRFLAVQACIILVFLIMRYALLEKAADLSLWQIVFYPFISVFRS